VLFFPRPSAKASFERGGKSGSEIVATPVALIAIAFLAAGCMLGPNFKTSQAPVAANWMERTDDSVKPTASEHRDWWTAFDDPALTRLIEVAYQRNLTVQTAGVRVLEARRSTSHGNRRILPHATGIGRSG